MRSLPRPFRTWLGGGLLALLLSRGVEGADLQPPRENERDWRKYQTQNFELYTNTRENESRRLLRELETFRYVVSRFIGVTNAQREPAMVFFFDNERSFRPYKPKYEGQPRAVTGFHVGDPLGHALAISRQGRTDSTMRVLFHEYTHLLTARQFRNAPVWAHEGIAEAFSTFASDGDQYDIGIAVTNHVRVLQRTPPAPVASLLGVTRDSPDYNEQNRAGRFYATSWLLAHHLIFARRGFETNVMARYATLCSSTTNQLEAFRLAFGNSPEELDARLAAYLRGGNYTLVRQTYPDLATARPQQSTLSAGELDFALGRLCQLTQQSDAARARLAEAIRRGPEDPRPHAALALLSWRERDRDALRTHTAEAVRLGSREAFLYFLAAESHYQEAVRLAQGSTAREEALEQGRGWCDQALEIDPDLAPAHHLMGVYALALNPRAPALAAVHVQQALRCDPDYQPAQLTWATLAAAQGNFAAARSVLARMLAGPLAPDLREQARQVAEQVERILSQRRTVPAAPR